MNPNHRILTREHFAEASALAGEGKPELARPALRAAAQHALAELAAQHDVPVSGDPAVTAERLADRGAAPANLAPLLRADSDDLDAVFAAVQAVIDTVFDVPGATPSDEAALVAAPSRGSSTSTVEAPAVAVSPRVPATLGRPAPRRGAVIKLFAVALTAVALLAGAISLAAGQSGAEQPRTAGEVATSR
jgi:hypothetical protein